MTWHSIILDPPPDGERVQIYSLEIDLVVIGICRGGHWYDETETLADGRAAELGGVTHWMPMPPKPILRRQC